MPQHRIAALAYQIELLILVFPVIGAHFRPFWKSNRNASRSWKRYQIH